MVTIVERMTEYLTIEVGSDSFDAIAAGPADGRPVLLLHGFPEAALAWEEQVSTLGAHGYRAIAPDQRGYSPSMRPTTKNDYESEEFVRDAFSIADRFGWNELDIVGHNTGGTVAWLCAAENPERVRSLTIASTPHPDALSDALVTDEEQQLRSAYLTEWRQSTTERKMLENDAQALRGIFEKRIPESHINEYVQRLHEPGALNAALNWFRANRRAIRIGTITTPTLYLWGTEDAAVGSTAALGTEKWVNAPYRFEMLEDVGHWIPEEVAYTMTSLLLEHLSAH
jgi:pimeloyl-ACP methyl ester carboxylesterase